MIGAFKPTARLSGGKLWKIPWRLSDHQKLRQRRRLRRVDNIIATLDGALKRHSLAESSHVNTPNTVATAAAAAAAEASTSLEGSTQPTSSAIAGADKQHAGQIPHDATPHAPPTAENTLSAAHEAVPATPSASALRVLESRRHGRGPKQGEMATVVNAAGVQVASETTTLASVAAARGTIKVLERWKTSMPTEAEMRPRDKYTIFDRKEKGYRKGIHKLPKWTRVSQRVNPPGF